MGGRERERRGEKPANFAVLSHCEPIRQNNLLFSVSTWASSSQRYEGSLDYDGPSTSQSLHLPVDERWRSGRRGGGAKGGGGEEKEKKTSFQLHRPNCIHVQTLRWEVDRMGAVLITSTQSPAFAEGTQCYCYRVNRRFSKTGTVTLGGRGGGGGGGEEGGLKHTKISITETPEMSKGDFYPSLIRSTLFSLRYSAGGVYLW